MRPTQLNFRSPQERTAEFKNFEVTKEGLNLNFIQKTKNASGCTLSRETRFKEAPLVDRATGQTVFLGPGSYNDHDCYINLKKNSCPTKIVSFS